MICILDSVRKLKKKHTMSKTIVFLMASLHVVYKK